MHAADHPFEPTTWRNKVETQFTDKLEIPGAARPPRRHLSEEDDRTLVAAAGNGRSEAFEILVHRHQPRILRSALRMTRNQADAEDIVQQSFQKAFIHLSQFQGHSSFSTWLTRIVINEALMLLRKKRYSVEVPIEQSSEGNGAALTFDFPYRGPSPEDSCFRQEQKRILSTALNELTPRVRKAIELAGLEELTTKEAARKVGVSVGAMKARVFQGRKKLKQVLESWMSPSDNLGLDRNKATCLT
jgi:RNA polymerase sigma-70 factor (ECF subfamily)